MPWRHDIQHHQTNTTVFGVYVCAHSCCRRTDGQMPCDCNRMREKSFCATICPLLAAVWHTHERINFYIYATQPWKVSTLPSAIPHSAVGVPIYLFRSISFAQVLILRQTCAKWLRHHRDAYRRPSPCVWRTIGEYTFRQQIHNQHSFLPRKRRVKIFGALFCLNIVCWQITFNVHALETRIPLPQSHLLVQDDGIPCDRRNFASIATERYRAARGICIACTQRTSLPSSALRSWFFIQPVCQINRL